MGFSKIQQMDSVSASTVKPIKWSIGLTGGILSFGGQAELILKNYIAFQIQHYNYQEFAGIMSNTAPYPTENYQMTSTNIGAYIKVPNFKIGLLSGVGFMDGIVRGRLLSSESASCILGCSGIESTYEKIEGKRVVIPLKFVIGGNWDEVGLTLSPQVYFFEGSTFSNVCLTLEFGFL